MSLKPLKFTVKSKTKNAVQGLDNANVDDENLDENKFSRVLVSWYKNISLSKVYPQSANEPKQPKTQLEHFQDSMWLLMFIGLCTGMNPIGFSGKKASDVRFTVFSIRFLTVLLIMSAQIILGLVSVYQLISDFNLFKLSYVAFYVSAGFINLSLIRVATKWPELVRDINESGLCGYIDPKFKRKCNAYVIFFMTFAIVEHLLAQLSLFLPIYNCQPIEGVHRTFTKITYSWFFSIGVPKTKAAVILLQVHSVVSTLIQSYSDVIVMCVSAYLTSIYALINAKISKSALQNHPPSTWRSLREHYNQASRLVRCFDDSINTLVFISYASNLFFICLQIYFLLGFGIYQELETNNVQSINCTTSTISASSGGSKLNIQGFYRVFSVLFLLGRFVCVTLTTANINSEATAPTVVLYNLSSESYCDESERFLQQVNNDTVALTGFRLFYVTRGLLLSVVATIITYELVLMQYNENLHI